MRRHRHRRVNTQDAELDITSFMNLMIVLVPVLLLSLVFSHVRILNLQLPVLSEAELSEDQKEPKILELVITKEYMELNYPAGILLKRFAVTEQSYDFAALSIYLQDLKLTFQQNTIEKQQTASKPNPPTPPSPCTQAEVPYNLGIASRPKPRVFKKTGNERF